MAKYDPLFTFLCKAPSGAVELTFDEIEGLVGALPAAAGKYAAWWSNQTTGGTNVQAKAWLNAGREVESADLRHRSVRFSDASWRRGA